MESRRSSHAHVRRKSVVDDAQLAKLGHKAELDRNFSPLAMLGLAFAILNSWTALSASLSLALPSGGPDAVIWGLVTAGICNLALAASLAEFLSAYPTAGGQYHWVAVISWKRWVPLLSFICGWINVFGWIALTASGVCTFSISPFTPLLTAILQMAGTARITIDHWLYCFQRPKL